MWRDGIKQIANLFNIVSEAYLAVNIFLQKKNIVDVWLGSKYASVFHGIFLTLEYLVIASIIS